MIIVPSTSQCEEGFAKICVEAILAERPVVTSAVCPALASIREAAIEVPPDNVEAYFRAIMALSNDRKLYERKRLACKPLQTQFYDLNNSWGARLRQLYNEILVAQSDSKKYLVETMLAPFLSMQKTLCLRSSQHLIILSFRSFVHLACTRFRRHQVWCDNGTGGGSWSGGSLRGSSSLKLCA